MINRSYIRPLVAGVLMLAMTVPASAHIVAGETQGFIHGFAHPIGGMDHMLTMIAVGLLAAMLGGRAIWLVPSAFLAMMAVGAALGMAHVGIPYVELGISLSVVVLGLAVAMQWPLSTVATMTIAGFFAVFHGHAHGAEMPVNISGASYAAGFLVATALLHATGIALGAGVNRLAEKREVTARIAGGAIAIVGVCLATL